MICHEMTKGTIDPDDISFPVIDEGLGNVWCSPKDGTNHYWSLKDALEPCCWDILRMREGRATREEIDAENTKWWYKGMRK